MRILLLIFPAFFTVASATAAPPREESPAPRELVEAFGDGSSDDEMARAIAAADAHPLGTLDNPIRVAGPSGAHAYIARLRCADGSAPRLSPESSGGVGAFGSMTMAYPLTCGSAPPVRLLFDLYMEEHVETRAPQGFRVSQ